MSFSMQLSNWTKKQIPRLQSERKEILMRLFRAVVMDTPVLEGTLRGNWRASAISPLTDQLANRNVTQVMSEIESVLSGARMVDDIYLRNNLPYAYPIEYYGHSSVKAPQGMVRKNVMRLSQIAEAVKRGSR